MSLLQNDVLSHLNQLLNSKNLEVLDQVIWGLGNMAGDSPSNRDIVINSGYIDKIANVLDNAENGSAL